MTTKSKGSNSKGSNSANHGSTKSGFDIKIEEAQYSPKNKFNSSIITLKFTGSDVNCKILNTIRRVACNNIPTYAFPSALINIQENTCVAFNNDYMRTRLEQLPIFDVDAGLYFLHNKYWKNVNFLDTNREKHPDEKKIQIYINVHNNSNELKIITTNEAKCFIDNEQVNIFDTKTPILVVILRPNDTFKCVMNSALAIGERHTIFCSAANAWHTYEEEPDKDGIMQFKSGKINIKSRGNKNEYQLLIDACDYLMKKFADLKIELDRRIKSKEIDDDKTIFFVLDGEDHTMGEILNYEFQEHKDIIFSGVSKPDTQISSMLFKITSAPSKKNPFEAMNECIDHLTKKIDFIKNKIINLSLKSL